MPKNPLIGSFEDAFEQGVSSVKQGVKQQASDTKQTVVSQITGQQPGGTPSVDNSGVADVAKTMQDQFNETGVQQQQPQDPHLDPEAIAKLDQQKQVESQQKLAQARQQLHKQYFQTTFENRPKEPSVQERLEQEKQEEEQKKMEALEEQKKKEPPVALQREQTRAETKFGAG